MPTAAVTMESYGPTESEWQEHGAREEWEPEENPWTQIAALTRTPRTLTNEVGKISVDRHPAIHVSNKFELLEEKSEKNVVNIKDERGKVMVNADKQKMFWQSVEELAQIKIDGKRQKEIKEERMKRQGQEALDNIKESQAATVKKQKSKSSQMETMPRCLSLASPLAD